MNTNLVTIVEHIIADYGEAVLADPVRLKAFFGDLAKDEPKPLRVAFGCCVEEGAYNALKTAPDKNERAERKAAIAQRVRDEHGLDMAISGEALDILEAALFADKQEPPRCASCGRELQDGWVSCPYCGAVKGEKKQEAPVVQVTSAQPAMPQQQAYLTPSIQEPAYQQPYQSAAPAVKKNPFQYFFGAFGKYAVFEGRARRAECWWFILFNLICNSGMGFIDALLGTYITEGLGIFNLLYILAAFLPVLALQVRRMHDCDKSGWCCLIPIYGLIIALRKGDTGPNRFGPDPKQPSPTAPDAKKKPPVAVLIAVAAVMVIALIGYFSQQSAPAGMVRITGGIFTMGSPASEPERWDGEGPQHSVTVSSFYMGKYEVTQKEWREVMGNNPSWFKGDDLPVEDVSWYDAVEYCNKRSQRECLTAAYTINGTNVTWNRNANGYRLPTEAEWEYACRAGTNMPFSTGNNITTIQANYNGIFPYNGNAKGTYRGETTPVGSFAPNTWGLYDMHGNVWEWCWDWYEDYAHGAQTDPSGVGSGSVRVRRGGSWFNFAPYLRSASRDGDFPAFRDGLDPSYQIIFVGFRLARSGSGG